MASATFIVLHHKITWKINRRCHIYWQFLVKLQLFSYVNDNDCEWTSKISGLSRYKSVNFKIFSCPLNRLNNTHHKQHLTRIQEHQIIKIQPYTFVKTFRLKFHVCTNPFGNIYNNGYEHFVAIIWTGLNIQSFIKIMLHSPKLILWMVN